MKLTDLDPRWLLKDGRRVGLIFISPVQRLRADGTFNPTPWRQTFFVERFSFKEQCEIVWPVMADLADEDSEFCFWQSCDLSRPAFGGWGVAGGIESASFETMSVTPSIDGSKGGLWHGHITNGEIR